MDARARHHSDFDAAHVSARGRAAPRHTFRRQPAARHCDARPGARIYRALLRVPDDQEIAIGIASAVQVRSKDPRGVVAGLDRIALDRLPGASPFDLLRELWLAPLLPAGLLLLAIGALILRLPRLLVGGTPALVLAALALLASQLPEARLRLASYVFAIGATSVAALALLTLLWHVPRLWPSTDRRSYNWLLVLFVVLVALAFIPTIKSDGMGYYVYLRSLTIDGDLNFGNDYRGWPDQQTPDQHITPRTATGYYVNTSRSGRRCCGARCMARRTRSCLVAARWANPGRPMATRRSTSC